jgi:hypothetical protein
MCRSLQHSSSTPKSSPKNQQEQEWRRTLAEMSGIAVHAPALAPVVTTDDDGYSTLPTSSAAGVIVAVERRARSASPPRYHVAQMGQQINPAFSRALSDSHLADDIRECSILLYSY